MDTVLKSPFSTIGIGYLGVVASTALYGLMCVQTFHYYLTLQRKDRWVRIWVAVLFLLDSLHQALIIHVFYWYLITNYGNPISLLSTVWSLKSELVLNDIIAFVVESLAVVRLWDLSSNKYLVSACAILATAQLASTLIYPIRLFSISTNRPDAELNLETTAVAGLSVAALTDIVLCASLTIYFRRSRIGFRKPDRAIHVLMSLTITTGFLTTLCCIAQLVSYAAASRSFYPLCFNFMMGKFYVNALLTSLDVNRSILKGYIQRADNPTVDSVALHHITQQLEDGNPITVAVQRVVQQDGDIRVRMTDSDSEGLQTKGSYKTFDTEVHFQ